MNNDKKFFDRNDLKELLEIFCVRVNEAGISGTISIVGGAAILLAYDPFRDQTEDIDALYPHSRAMDKIILKIAEERGIQSDWLNGAAEEFVPYGITDAWVDYKEIHGIQLRIATPEFLLAMKLAAGRPLRDFRDLTLLIDMLQINSMEECRVILKKFNIRRAISQDTVDFVEKTVELNRGDSN